MKRHAAVLVLLAALTCTSASAQGIDSDAAQCFGFSFGTWKPALDLTIAGHSPTTPGPLLKAPGGRDWASDATPNDTTLFLFPAWWPAGVQVTFPRRPRSPADTVPGEAMALVADGRATPPRAPMRVWRVACR
ncbi:MAG TPA: hypothetical protein VJ717_08685 [Gemmatimonadaceae bacterium]|nr:hypothetical protein [Gemmatimonadaceae bacterium]